MEPDVVKAVGGDLLGKLVIALVGGLVGSIFGAFVTYFAAEHRERRNRLRQFVAEIGAEISAIAVCAFDAESPEVVGRRFRERAQRVLALAFRSAADISDEHTPKFQALIREVYTLCNQQFTFDPLASRGSTAREAQIKEFSDRILQLADLTKQLGQLAEEPPPWSLDRWELPEK